MKKDGLNFHGAAPIGNLADPGIVSASRHWHTSRRFINEVQSFMFSVLTHSLMSFDFKGPVLFLM